MAKKKIEDNEILDSFYEKKITKCCGSVNYQNISHDDLKAMHNIAMQFHSLFSGMSNVIEYYFIWHTDTDTLHMHYAFTLSRQSRIKTLLNIISTELQVNPLAVNIKNMTSLCSQLRYFLHSDTKSITNGKTLFSIDDIYSNMTKDIIQSYIDSDDEGLSFTRLLELCVNAVDDNGCMNELSVMNSLGLQLFHKYRYEIKIILDNSLRSQRMYNQLLKGDNK